jgi:hypothetical protein
VLPPACTVRLRQALIHEQASLVTPGSCGLQLAESRFERECIAPLCRERFMNPFAHPWRISSVHTRTTFLRLQCPLHPVSGAAS